jgi:hypothetical protein
VLVVATASQWRSQTFYIVGAADFFFLLFIYLFIFLPHEMNGYFLNFFLLFLILVLKYNEELSLELCQILQFNI